MRLPIYYFYHYINYSYLDLYQKADSVFSNQDDLGVFISNHDNERWLHMFPSWETFKSAIVFTLFSKGIPIFYYGDEQGFAGGRDPDCRETLWTNMNEQHELYKYVQELNKIRTEK